MAMTNLTIKVDARNLPAVKAFIVAVNEIAGTTNDPNTATNLRAALDKLYGRIKLWLN
jgi:hypothetical protein